MNNVRRENETRSRNETVRGRGRREEEEGPAFSWCSVCARGGKVVDSGENAQRKGQNRRPRRELPRSSPRQPTPQEHDPAMSSARRACEDTMLNGARAGTTSPSRGLPGTAGR